MTIGSGSEVRVSVFDPGSLHHLFQQRRRTLVIFKQCTCVSQEGRVHVIRWYCRRDTIDIRCYHFWLIIFANVTSPLCSTKAKLGDRQVGEEDNRPPAQKALHSDTTRFFNRDSR